MLWLRRGKARESRGRVVGGVTDGWHWVSEYWRMSSIPPMRGSSFQGWEKPRLRTEGTLVVLDCRTSFLKECELLNSTCANLEPGLCPAGALQEGGALGQGHTCLAASAFVFGLYQVLSTWYRGGKTFLVALGNSPNTAVLGTEHGRGQLTMHLLSAHCLKKLSPMPPALQPREQEWLQELGHRLRVVWQARWHRPFFFARETACQAPVLCSLACVHRSWECPSCLESYLDRVHS